MYFEVLGQKYSKNGTDFQNDKYIIISNYPNMTVQSKIVSRELNYLCGGYE